MSNFCLFIQFKMIENASAQTMLRAFLVTKKQTKQAKKLSDVPSKAKILFMQ